MITAVLGEQETRLALPLQSGATLRSLIMPRVYQRDEHQENCLTQRSMSAIGDFSTVCVTSGELRFRMRTLRTFMEGSQCDLLFAVDIEQSVQPGDLQ